MPDIKISIVGNTASFDDAAIRALNNARKSAGGIQDAFNGIDVSEGRGGIMVFDELLGIHIPRHVTSLMATLPGLGTAMAAALPIFAIVAVGAAVVEFAEKLTKAREKTAELADAQTKLGTEGQRALNSLGEKFLELGIKADELRGDHFSALQKQLKLIDAQSMDTLASTFDHLAEHTDAYFKQMKASWYTIGIGSAGAQNALNSFQVKYDELLAKGDKAGASDLLKGTKQSAEDTLNAMNTMNSAAGQRYRLDNSVLHVNEGSQEIAAANLLLAKNKVGLSEDELHSQERLVAVLSLQGDIQKANDKNTDAAKDDTKAQNRLKVFADEKAKSEEALALRVAQLETSKSAAIKSYTEQGLALDAAKRKADAVYDPQIVQAQVDEITTLVKDGAKAGISVAEQAALAGKAAVITEHAKKAAIDETTAAQQRAIAKSITAGEADAKIYKDTVDQAAKELQEKLAHVAALAKIDDEHLKAELANGQISEKQYEAQLQAELAATKKNDLDILADELKLYDTGSADYERVKKQMQQINDKYLADKQKAEDAANQKQSSGFMKQLQDWKNVQKQMQQVGMQTFGQMNTGLTDLITKGKADWKGMAQSAVTSILDIGLHYAESYVAMAVEHALFGDQTSAQDTIRLASAISTNAAIAQSSAWEAAATTLADVPYPANIDASAEVLDLGLGYAAGASASQGAVLPNREMMVHTHPEEMILPRNISQHVIHSMNNSGSGEGGKGDTLHIHNNINAGFADASGVSKKMTQVSTSQMNKFKRQNRNRY